MKKTHLFLTFLTVPLLCCCARSAEGTKDEGIFEYKEIYLSDALGSRGKDLGLNSVDEDWGLWGHNLRQVLPMNPSALVYATVDGEHTKEQFCFSSDKLYEYIVHFIIDAYGEDETQRFAILANDNDIVCQCRLCREAGNTPTNASPAVLTMIERLARRFPKHLFFTSHYGTAKSIPNHKMPGNTGVLVSAMDYPLCPVETKHDAQFENLLRQWAGKVDHVYVWDYINNFDDYFTPFPMFRIMQRRLQMYARNNVKGVFLNGSGTDYSTWQYIHAMVLADLLKNPNLDCTKLIRDHCEKRYPKAGKLVADFMVTQEDWTARQGKVLPLYGGVSQAIKSYLPAKEFTDFHNAFAALVTETSGEERKVMDRLCRAMSLTRMELMRLSGNIDGYQTYYDHLAAMKAKNTEVYSEACWTVEAYLKDYEEMARHAAEAKDGNMLLGKELTALSALDEDYSDISILTDGLLGLPSNYHCGQMISSAKPELLIGVPHVAGMKKIRVWTTRNAPCHIIFPEKIILTCGGVKIAEATPEPMPLNYDRSMVELSIPPTAKGELVLKIVRNMQVRTMAIDEIEAY